MLAFVDGVNFKHGVEVLPNGKKVSICEVIDMATICKGFSIYNEMTTPKSRHDVVTSMET